MNITDDRNGKPGHRSTYTRRGVAQQQMKDRQMFRHEDEAQWQQPPGHINAFSRYLVGPDHDSRQFDFRTSRYPPGGYVEEHAHEVEEQVYYILSGTGSARCGGETRELGPGSVMFVPARVVHGMRNEGTEDLTFVIVTSPPGIPR